MNGVIRIYLLLMLFSAPLAAGKILYLEVVINGNNTTQVLAVTQKENDWEVSAAELAALGITLDFPHGERLLLSEFPGASVRYDEVMQRLLLTVPASALPMQTLNTMYRSAPVAAAKRDSGVFLNYDFLIIDDDTAPTQSSVWHELYWFQNNFYTVNRGILREGYESDIDEDYLRFETYYQRDSQSGLWGLTIGDVINATPNWGTSIRMGGIRIARDYELDPNLITYPLPEFFGEAALPGSIDLLINDQLRWSEQVSPGPFSINTMPYMSGAGIAEVVTTNVQGQQARQKINFYVTSEILSPGLLDYDFTLGTRRKNFGLVSNEYDEKLTFSGSIRYGWTDYATPQILLQGGDSLRLAGLGVSLLAGNVGVFEISHTASDHRDEQGEQQSFAYSYSRSRLGFSARYLQRQGMYRDLGNLDRGVLRDSQWQVAASYHHDVIGSLNLGYFRVFDDDFGRREFATLSWNRYFDSGITLFANINRQLYGEDTHVLSLALSVPLGERGQASLGGQRDAENSWRNQFQAMSNPPYSGGLGWNVGVDDAAEKNVYANVDWRAKRYEASASLLRNGDRQQLTGGLSGALVAMDNSLYHTRYVVDSFAVVNAGEANIPVMLGNQLVGNTNSAGKILVPDLSSHLENRIAIDPIKLPANASIDAIEQMVVPKRKGGVQVDFPVVFLASALVEAVDTNEQPLPVGTVLVADVNEQEFIVGWGGEVYIEQLTRPMKLFWEEGDCVISVSPAVDTSESLPRLGKVICQPVERMYQ